jgi:hypothetical protein
MDAIRVIIPRDLHIGDEAFEAVEIGEKVEVEIKKSRFQVNDPYILSVGAFRSSKGKGAAPTASAASAVPESFDEIPEVSEDEDEAEDEAEDEDDDIGAEELVLAD